MPPPIQVCQPGFDVRKCPDWAYLFNGNWPNLAIAFEKTVNATSGSGTVLTHNLGFMPLVMAWYTAGGVTYGRVPGLQLQSDKNVIIINTTGQITVRAYNIDISKEASYPLPQSANAKLPYNSNFGMKVAKDGRFITSNNLNDFILHTRAQSPAVLNVATEQGKYYLRSNARHYWPYGAVRTWDLIVYPLQTSYVPWATGVYDTGSGLPTFGSGQDVYYDSTSNSLVLNISAYGTGSLIVLRDPLFYPNVLQVIY